jgi:hypothetical protein
MFKQSSAHCGDSPAFKPFFQQANLVSENKQVANPTEHALLERIEKLDCALQNKDRELQSHFQEQLRMSECLTDINQTLERTLQLLATANNEFADKNQKLLDQIVDLQQENLTLILSNNAWSQYAIKLGFQGVSVKNQERTILQILRYWVFKKQATKS